MMRWVSNNGRSLSWPVALVMSTMSNYISQFKSDPDIIISLQTTKYNEGTWKDTKIHDYVTKLEFWQLRHTPCAGKLL